jgi:hypothetical protein
MSTLRSLSSLWCWAFARTYLRDKRRWGEPQASLWSAITELSISMSFNVLAVVAALAWALRLPSHVEHPREVGLGVMALALGANALRFGRQDHAEQLAASLDADEQATRRDERNLLGYTALSFLAPVLIVLARLWLHR